MDRLHELVARIEELNHQYYVLDKPTVSDLEYDALYDELVALERESGVVLPNSPTRRVGGEPLSAFERYTHLAKLWSLDKARTGEEIMDWASRLYKLGLTGLSFALERKYDGLTINLFYEGGRLANAATRGNGSVGEAILPQVMTIRSVPLAIPFTGRMEVQGEGYMKLSALARYNETAQVPLKNARNAAAGALRNLDPKETAKRSLSAVFYNVGFIEGRAFSSQDEMLGFLKEQGFPTGETWYGGLEELLGLLPEREKERDKLDYLIDGMVFKTVDFAAREAAGYTEKFPRWAVAFKFEAEEATTQIKAIRWEAGRTGKLTPLALLEPVEIGGASVSRATLNNMGDIERKAVYVGARVFVRRSGDVIPEILGLADESECGPTVAPPARCPSCGAHVEARGAHLYCTNTLSCAPQIVARLSHFASREAMNIESFSEKSAKLFVDTLGIISISDLYKITREQLMALPGFGEKRIAKLFEELGRSKSVELPAFLYALGIPNVGSKLARVLALEFGSLEALMDADAGRLAQIFDVGQIVADSVVSFFGDERIREELNRLLELGVSPKGVEREAAVENAFSGKTVVFTGTLTRLGRKEAESIVERLGGKAASSVSAKTYLVVAGEKAGSKLDKANQLGVTVIGEDEFIERIKKYGFISGTPSQTPQEEPLPLDSR